jgi:membrane-bound ClpP family serine protease
VPTSEHVYDAIQDLSPETDPHRALKAQAFQLMIQLASTHSLMQAQVGSSINGPFLVVVVFWLTINFISFGLFAPANATVAVTLFVCALSVAGAVFLIVEMDQPFEGVIRIADTPLRDALGQLGR